MRADPPEPVTVEPLTRVVIGPDDLDTDADGIPDTALVPGPDLELHSDLDGDGLADQVLRLDAATLGHAPETPEFRWWAPWTWFTDT